MEEKTGLDLAFTKLAFDTGAKHVYFWGKIFGSTADYFIAYIFKKIELGKLPNKEFYYWYNILLNTVPQTPMN